MAEIYLAWKDVCKWMERVCLDTETDFDYVYSRMAEIPPADVRPVVRGEWLNEDSASNYLAFKCSVCGTGGRLYKFPFCSQCGADMRGGDADGDEED